jgi:uncharacterized membrane protein YtjA (UPF0391 family)
MKHSIKRDASMLRLALFCLVIALIAGALVLTGVAGVAMGVAKFIFGLFLALFMILLIVGVMIGRAIT